MFALFLVSIMASPLPSVPIPGHSFVKRLHSDLQWQFDLLAALDFNLTSTATVSFHGVGGLTVPRLARELRLLFSHQPPPRVIILEIGINDLTSHSPEVVSEDLLDLVEFLQFVCLFPLERCLAHHGATRWYVAQVHLFHESDEGVQLLWRHQLQPHVTHQRKR